MKYYVRRGNHIKSDYATGSGIDFRHTNNIKNANTYHSISEAQKWIDDNITQRWVDLYCIMSEDQIKNQKKKLMEQR